MSPGPLHLHGLGITLALFLFLGVDSSREALPPTSPAFRPPEENVLLAENFQTRGLAAWEPDRPGVWTLRYGMLRADLPDHKQLRSFIYAGSENWTDYIVDLDVCQIRGVDKGIAVRVQGKSGVGVDLRGPGYQDLVMYRREWPMGRARVVNGNGVWQHLRVEVRGSRYRVWVNGDLAIDRTDSHSSLTHGRIALPAYTGGVGECTLYYDNVIVTTPK